MQRQILWGGLAGAAVIAGGVWLAKGRDSLPAAALLAPTPEAAAPRDVPEAQPPAAAAPEPAANPAPDPAPEPAPVAAAAAPPTPGLQVDTVRIDPDGMSVLAGRVDGGANAYAVLLDGREIAEIAPEADGSFVSFLEIAPAAMARRLSLHPRTGDAPAWELLVAPQSPGAESPQPAAPQPASDGGTDDAIARPTAPATQQAAPPPEALPLAEAPGGPAAEGAASNLAPEPSAPDTIAPDPVAPEVAALTPVAPNPGAPESIAPEPVASAAPESAPGAAQTAPMQAAPPAPDRPQAPTVLVSDAEGVGVVQSADGAAPDRVLLDTIAYDDLGAVRFSGRSGPGSGPGADAESGAGAVQIYLDNRPVAAAPIRADGSWRAELPPEIGRGVYALRVDQLDGQGQVVSRLETPFLRESVSDVAGAFAPEGAAPPPDLAVRVVQPGNTLWAIARDRYGEGMAYVQVYEANADQIRDPDLIYPGQIFDLPDLPLVSGEGAL